MVSSLDVDDHLMLEHVASLLIGERAREACSLIDNWFGMMLQLTLGIISFSTLLFKWYREHPRRPLGIWCRDTSKQAMGALLLHIYNIIFSNVLSGSMYNPCTYYFLNFMLDTILGCLMNYLFLLAWNKLALASGSQWFLSGYYGHPPKWRIWMIQLSQWLIITTAVKMIIIYALIVPFKQPLYNAASTMLSPVEPYPKFMLTLVMIIIPLIINSVVFWVQDWILMDSDVSKLTKPNEDLTDKEYFMAQEQVHGSIEEDKIDDSYFDVANAKKKQPMWHSDEEEDGNHTIDVESDQPDAQPRKSKSKKVKAASS